MKIAMHSYAARPPLCETFPQLQLLLFC